VAEVLAQFRAFVRDRLVPAPRLAVEILGAASAPTKPTESGYTAESSEPAEQAKAYEGAEMVLETLEEIEAFRSKLSCLQSNITIAD